MLSFGGSVLAISNTLHHSGALCLYIFSITELKQGENSIKGPSEQYHPSVVLWGT